MVSFRTSPRLVASICLVSMLAAGCGCSQPKGQIKGKVLFQGEPLHSGTVTFVGADGNEVFSPISSEGVYQVSGLAVGDARISVVSHPAVPEGFTNFPGPPGPGLATAPPEKVVRIPSNYNYPDKSGLTYTVKAGQQTFTIELEP